MPDTSVVFYRESDGTCPFLEWFNELPPPKVQDKCYLRLARMRELSHELRRPEADFLRDEINELRISFRGFQHRILYFFNGRVAAVISHGLEKYKEVPPAEIDCALARKRRFERDPRAHTYVEA